MERACAESFASELTAAELAALDRWLRKCRFAGRHLEIGTAAGGTLCALMEVYRDQAGPEFVVVDPMTYFTGQEEVVKENLRRHNLPIEKVELRVARSWDAYQRAKLANESFDFILVDGTHKFRYVIQDLHWAGLLNVGGLLCLHDHAPAFRSVTLAAKIFLAKNRNYAPVEQVDSLLVVRKERPDGGSGVRLLGRAASGLIHVGFQVSASVSTRLRRKRDRTFNVQL